MLVMDSYTCGLAIKEIRGGSDFRRETNVVKEDVIT